MRTYLAMNLSNYYSEVTCITLSSYLELYFLRSSLLAVVESQYHFLLKHLQHHMVIGMQRMIRPYQLADVDCDLAVGCLPISHLQLNL